jgi:hypothetical protein
VYFGLVFGAGFVLGAIRVTFLVPRLGARLAELAEMPIMFIVTIFAARYVVLRFALPPSRRLRSGVGVVALLMLLLAEVLLAVALQHRTLAEYIASRDPVSGVVYVAMLLIFATMPCFQA